MIEDIEDVDSTSTKPALRKMRERDRELICRALVFSRPDYGSDPNEINQWLRTVEQFIELMTQENSKFRAHQFRWNVGYNELRTSQNRT